jgi:hypothetical protein
MGGVGRGANLPSQTPLLGAGALHKAVLVRGVTPSPGRLDRFAEPLRISRGEDPDEALEPGVVVLHGTAVPAGGNAEAVTHVQRHDSNHPNTGSGHVVDKL